MHEPATAGFNEWKIDFRKNFAAGSVRQAGEALVFIDFLREPQLDPETGEPLDVHFCFYEAVPGGMEETRQASIGRNPVCMPRQIRLSVQLGLNKEWAWVQAEG